MKVHFVTYYDDTRNVRYLNEAERTKKNALRYFSDVTIYNREMLIKEKFYEDNKKILDQERYAGWCLWKPFYIHKKLIEIDNDDIVFYMDIGDVLHNNIKTYLKSNIEENNGFFLVKNNHLHKRWTTKDCFYLMGCDEEKYWSETQLEAGTIGLKKTKETIKFVEEWLMYCQNENILTKNNIYENYPEYCGDNRADQSILTNLHIKYGIKTVPFGDVMNYIVYNMPC